MLCYNDQFFVCEELTLAFLSSELTSGIYESFVLHDRFGAFCRPCGYQEMKQNNYRNKPFFQTSVQDQTDPLWRLWTSGLLLQWFHLKHQTCNELIDSFIKRKSVDTA